MHLLGRGYNYDEIAEDLGYASRGSAWRLVRNALLANVTTEFEQYRTAEILRLDAIQDKLMPLLNSHDVAASYALLKVSDQRSRLHGLYSEKVRRRAQAKVPSRP